MKRFTETLKWQDPWFRRLSGPAKMLWLYALDHCDNIGIVELDFPLVSTDLKTKVTEKHLFEFGDRLQDIGNGKYFLPKFIGFQYGTLSPNCPAHKRVIQACETHGLEVSDLGYCYPSIRNLTRDVIPKRKGREEGKEEDKDSTSDSSEKINARTNGIRRPSLPEAHQAGQQLGILPHIVETWWLTREASGWIKGTAGGATAAVGTNWRADLQISKGWASDPSKAATGHPVGKSAKDLSL